MNLTKFIIYYLFYERMKECSNNSQKTWFTSFWKPLFFSKLKKWNYEKYFIEENQWSLFDIYSQVTKFSVNEDFFSGNNCW